MRDRHVRHVFLALIVAFPILVAWVSSSLSASAARGIAAYGPIAGVEAAVVAGLFAAAFARRRLLAAGSDIGSNERQNGLAHISQPTVYAPASSFFEGAAR